MDNKVPHSTEFGELISSNASTEISPGRYSWSIHLEGPASTQIASVQYVLHPTFPNPVRVRKSAHDGFRLETKGWGEFTVDMKVRFKDGSQKSLQHPLRFK